MLDKATGILKLIVLPDLLYLNLEALLQLKKRMQSAY
jgi:hypothetical protein